MPAKLNAQNAAASVDRTDLEAVKSYLYIRVRLLFDPPQSSFLLGALEKQADEFLWRLANSTEGAP